MLNAAKETCLCIAWVEVGIGGKAGVSIVSHAP